MNSTGVDAYLAALPEARRTRLAAVRALVREAVPDAVESIEWKMPVFRRGDRWFGMANRGAYVSLYFAEQAIADRVAAADKRLKHGKACVNVPDTVPLPEEALRAGIVAAL